MIQNSIFPLRHGGSFSGTPRGALVSDDAWNSVGFMRQGGVSQSMPLAQPAQHGVASDGLDISHLDGELAKYSQSNVFSLANGMSGTPRTPRNLPPIGIGSGVFMDSASDPALMAAFEGVNAAPEALLTTADGSLSFQPSGPAPVRRGRGRRAGSAKPRSRPKRGAAAASTSPTTGKAGTSRAWRPAGQAKHIRSVREEDDFETVQGPNGPVRRERKNNREKRRRQAMNDRFDELTDVLLEDKRDEKLQQKVKWNKADVLAEAIRAIRGLRDEVDDLSRQLEA
jgi:hypothetical protein